MTQNDVAEALLWRGRMERAPFRKGKHGADRYAEIVYRRFLKEPPDTFDSIAHHFGVSRERIRQMQEKALRVMRHPENPVVATRVPYASRLREALCGDYFTAEEWAERRRRLTGATVDA